MSNTFSGSSSGSVAQVGHVGGDVNQEYHHHGPAPTALDGLPGLEDTAPGFTGRDADLARVLTLLDPASDAGGGGVVAAVGGMGGVGKTALAVAAGHAARDRGWFSGVLFIDLRGYGSEPVTPDQATSALLRAVGVPPAHIPPTLEEQVGLYRSRLAELAREQGAPLLVVADNASHVRQIKPLLPGAGGHRLLVTSRHRLPGLGAAHLDVNVLALDDAVGLLRTLLSRADPTDERAGDEAGLTAIATSCACLPLTLQVCGALLTRYRSRGLDRQAAVLANAAVRLDLADGELPAARAVFDASYELLAPEQARVFELLGVAPGDDISTPAAAVLADTTQEEVTEILDELANAHLITRDRATDRWGMHDLLADYARVCAGEAARDGVREGELWAGVGRVLAYYTRMAGKADAHLRALPGAVVPEEFSGREEALAWLDAERAVLVAAVHTAWEMGHTDTAIALPLYLGVYLDWRRHFTDQITISAIARDTAQQVGDRRREARAWNNLGLALQGVERFAEAVTAHEHDLAYCQQVGDRHGEAVAWNNLGSALRRVERFEEAITAHETARALFQQVCDRHGEAMAWRSLGLALRGAGRGGEASAALERAVDLFAETHDEYWRAIVEESLTQIHTPPGGSAD